jgi:N-acetylneuraminate epimerase
VARDGARHLATDMPAFGRPRNGDQRNPPDPTFGTSPKPSPPVVRGGGGNEGVPPTPHGRTDPVASSAGSGILALGPSIPKPAKDGIIRAFILSILLAAFAPPAPAGEWSQLAPLPDKLGVAGAFAGVSGGGDGSLLVAGGANFPDKKPWEGGRKVWSDAVYVLPRPGVPWELAGRLPRPLGYGVSASYRDGVVCVGGSDADRHYADAFRLEVKAGKLVTTPLPPLPVRIANGCGTLLGDVLYVAGGQDKPDATTASAAVYRIDLAAADPRWQVVDPIPGGGRILAVAAACDGAFWVAGGAALVPGGADGKPARLYLADAYRYDPAAGWRRVADLPRPAVAAPSPAPADGRGFYVLGGDDGSQTAVPPDRHRSFGDSVLRFDLKSAKWTEAGKLPAPRVTTACVSWGRSWVVPSGEMRPGVRSPEVWRWTPDPQRTPGPQE